MLFLGWLPGLLLFSFLDPDDQFLAGVAIVALAGPVGPVGPVGPQFPTFLCPFPCSVFELKPVLSLLVLQMRKLALLCENLVG